MTLLQKVTDHTGRGGGGWAWFRLGLHHMSQSQDDEAVKCFQCAVEINPHDRLVQYLNLVIKSLLRFYI